MQVFIPAVPQHVTGKVGLLIKYLVTLWAGEAVLGQNILSRFMENSVVISQVSLVGKLLIA